MRRLKPLRVTMLIEPPTAFAGRSGVGTFVISIRSRFAVLVPLKLYEREEGSLLAACAPSNMTSVPLDAMPRRPIPSTSPVVL